MTINQLSIFVENKAGALGKITHIPAQENIDIRAMSIADTKDFGILRLIVSDVEKAKEALDTANQTITEKSAEIEDLAKKLEEAENKEIAKDCSKFGKAFELVNIKDDKTLYYKRLDPLFTFDVFATSILEERIASITYIT